MGDLLNEMPVYCNTSTAKRVYGWQTHYAHTYGGPQACWLFLGTSELCSPSLLHALSLSASQVCMSLPLCLSLCLSVPLSLHIYLSLFLSLSVSLPATLSLPLSLSVSLSQGNCVNQEGLHLARQQSGGMAVK